MVGGSPAESQRAAPGALDRVTPNGSGVVALNKHTGQVVYQTANELASYASLQLAKVDGRDWCLAFLRDALVGLDPASGRVDFRFPWRARKLESVNASTPIVHGNQVLITETYGPGSALLTFGPGSAEVVWQDRAESRQRSLQCHWCTPILHDGFVYASSGRHTQDAELRCVEWSTGKVRWSQPDLTRCSLLYVDSHLVCLGEDGVLRLLRATPDKYDEVAVLDWRKVPGAAAGETGPDYPAWAPPILSHGLLYVRGRSQLYCLELSASPR
jgi:outer membrane protein assembly factor BamB